MRNARITIAGVGTVALMALTGCARDTPDPAARSGGSAPPTTSASGARSAPPSVTTTSAPIRAAIPPAARAHTTEGAKAFAAYWVKSVGEGLLNGSSVRVRALSAPACKGCQSMIEWTDDLVSKNQRISVAPQSVLTSEVRAGSSRQLVGLDAFVLEEPYKIMSAEGGVVESSAGEGSSIRMSIRWANGRWVTDQFDLVQA